MKLQGVLKYLSQRTGTKKDGTSWYQLKCLDESSDEIIVMFVTEQLFNEFSRVERKAEVTVTLDLVPGQKYFSLVDFELN